MASVECCADKVTWCFGHMLEQAEPDEYTPMTCHAARLARRSGASMSCPSFPRAGCSKQGRMRKQLAVIGKLLREAREIVNAGDPDREGQLLVDEVLEHFRNSKPVRRFWVSPRRTRFPSGAAWPG